MTDNPATGDDKEAHEILPGTAPQAVLLDLGNVVLDVDFRRVFAAWAAATDVDASHFHRRWRMDDHYARHETGRLRFRDYANYLSSHFDVDMPLARWREGWNAVFVGLFPSVMDLLQTLHRQVPVYAFTNTNPTHEHALLRRYPELEVFRQIYASSRIGLRKPDVEAYRYVAGRMGVAPDAIWFLDDNRDNVEGARAAGMQAFRIHSVEDTARILRHVVDLARG